VGGTRLRRVVPVPVSLLDPVPYVPDSHIGDSYEAGTGAIA